MDNKTPESLAKNFARRWFSHESAAMRQLGEQELIKIIHAATAEASKQWPDRAPAGQRAVSA